MYNLTKKYKIFVCLGTRADIIKMVPIIREFEKCKDISLHICLSGQHKELAQIAVDEFSIKYDNNLRVMKENQSLDYLMSAMLVGYSKEMRNYCPDMVLVHGDTATALSATLAARYLKIPIVHIEAGLRTRLDTPFPEELHRTLITDCAQWFMCPNEQDRANLLLERVNDNQIFITGNSIVDVIYDTVSYNYKFVNPILREYNFERRREIVITLHRRELTIDELLNISGAIRNVVAKVKDVVFIWPVHPNPKIKKVIKDNLYGIDNIVLLEPLSAHDMHNLIFRSAMVVTDSGGVQEESYYMNKLMLVMRHATERPDCFDKNRCKLIDPIGVNIDDEIIKMLEQTTVETDFSIIQKLSQKIGASKRIVSTIVDILENRYE